MKTKNYDGPVLVLACALVFAALCSCAVPAAAKDIVPDGKYPIWINESGVYNLTTDINFHSPDPLIRINATDVIFDGRGHQIDGEADKTKGRMGIWVGDLSSPGRDIVPVRNVTVRNVTASQFQVGITYFHVNDGAIEACEVWGCDDVCVSLDNSWENVIKDSRICSNAVGLDMYISAQNTIYNNYLDNFKQVRNFETMTNWWNTTNSTGPNIIDGPFIGGNYWVGNTNTTDENNDGFCDQPYVLYKHVEGSIQDELPLTVWEAPPVNPPTTEPTAEPTTEPTTEPTRISSNNDGGDWADRVSAHGPIEADDWVEFTFRNLPITRVDLSVNSPVSGALVKIIPNELPPDVDAPEGRAVLGVYEIVIRYVGDNLDECRVYFEIPENWLESKGLKPEDIVLKYYDDGAWKDLPTELLRLEGGKAYYRAQASGFPYFAIAETRGGAVTPKPVATSAEAEAEDTPVTETEIETEVGTTGTAEETSAATTAPDAAETTLPQPSPISCLAAAAACALVVLVMRRD